MAITFVAAALGGTTTTTAFSITLPATQVGDLLLLEYTHRGTGDGTLGGTYTGPAFVKKHDQPYATSTFSGKTWWSRATGDHVGQTVTGSGLTNSCAAIVTIYRGAERLGDPLTASGPVVGEQNASGDETQAQIITRTDKAWVVLVVVNSPDLDVSTQATTSPGALTERAERLSTGGTDTSIAHASAEKATAGATGAFTWAQTNAASGSWAYAIRPDRFTRSTIVPIAERSTVSVAERVTSRPFRVVFVPETPATIYDDPDFTLTLTLDTVDDVRAVQRGAISTHTGPPQGKSGSWQLGLNAPPNGLRTIITATATKSGRWGLDFEEAD